MHALTRSALVAALVTASAACAQGQDIAQQVRQKGSGTLTLVFASKPGVCGNGRNSISMNDHDNYNWEGYRHCEVGPVQVEMEISNGAVTHMDTYVGGQPRPGIVRVSTRAASSYLLDLAQRSNSASVGKHAILPAILADSVEPYPELLTIARNESLSREIRKTAVFWLGQAAGDKATDGIKSLVSDPDVEVKKSAVFALSQMRGEQSLTALMDVAEHSKDPQVRKSALFWLAQSNDPRALSVFEKILLRK